MPFFLDGASTVRQIRCPDCASTYLDVRSFVLDEVGPRAIVITALHQHNGFEAWMDVTFGSFGDDEASEPDDHFTFGCRVGKVDGSTEPAATAVEAGVSLEDSPVFGRKLTRDEALRHPRIDEFWAVVDFMLEAEPAIRHHVYDHLDSRTTKRRWWRRS